MQTIFVILMAAQATLAVVLYFKAMGLLDDVIEAGRQVEVGGGL